METAPRSLRTMPASTAVPVGRLAETGATSRYAMGRRIGFLLLGQRRMDTVHAHHSNVAMDEPAKPQ